MVVCLERDLAELLVFLSFRGIFRKKLRSTNVIERVFVEVRRRTRPMVCFVNVASADGIIYSIFQRFNLEWRNAPAGFLHKQLDITLRPAPLTSPFEEHIIDARRSRQQSPIGMVDIHPVG
jgi:transposase-like protein